MHSHIAKVLAYYNDNAADTAARLHPLAHDAILPQVDALLPAGPFKLLDVGAGSGRDAAHYAALGHAVTAVEPAKALCAIGQQNTQGLNVRWLADALPDLPQVQALGEKFDVVLLSAVWMFLPPEARLPSLLTLKNMLAPNGLVVMTVQSASGARAELKHFTTEAEYQALAAQAGLQLQQCSPIPDSKGRGEWAWQLVVLA